MPARKTIAAVVIILVAIGGFVAGLFLLRQRQELREEAAVPGGQAEVSLFPEVGDFNVGDTFPVSIFFNTANIAASGVSVLLTYPYSGATPEFIASNIEINSVLLSSGDWTCPTRKISAQTGSVEIEIGCANVSAGGFSTSADTLLATFNMTVERVPAVEPVVLRFDSSKSVITQKTDGQDILLIPVSTGEYLVAGQASVPTATVVPTTALPTLAPNVTATLTPTVFTTVTPSPSPTSATTTTPTATGAAQLPDAGVSYPTILGIGLGLFFIVGALMLAL